MSRVWGNTICCRRLLCAWMLLFNKRICTFIVHVLCIMTTINMQRKNTIWTDYNISNTVIVYVNMHYLKKRSNYNCAVVFVERKGYLRAVVKRNRWNNRNAIEDGINFKRFGAVKPKLKQERVLYLAKVSPTICCYRHDFLSIWALHPAGCRRAHISNAAVGLGHQGGGQKVQQKE